ncbi:MAG: TIGR00725 family protein [Acidobacteriota bacterium]
MAVVGAGRCGPELTALAHETGERLATSGITLLTGGRGGVMAAASAGARAAGGRTVAVLPGLGAESNSSDEILIPTGLGQGRNLVLVLSARAVIAIGGGWGTLSEIALALKHGIPVISLRSWQPRLPDGTTEERLAAVTSPADAVEGALRAMQRWPRLGLTAD